MWNSLPAAVHHTDNLHSFNSRLKSHFFHFCFSAWQCNAWFCGFRSLNVMWMFCCAVNVWVSHIEFSVTRRSAVFDFLTRGKNFGRVIIIMLLLIIILILLLIIIILTLMLFYWVKHLLLWRNASHFRLWFLVVVFAFWFFTL